MSNEDMISAITNAIQTDSNLIILLKAAVAKNIVNVPTPTLEAIMVLLNLPTS